MASVTTSDAGTAPRRLPARIIHGISAAERNPG